MVVDRAWCLIGSANWDARSLRLNFEIDLECYSAALGERLDALFRDKLREAVPITADLIDGRGLGARLRDGAARLLSPYL